MVLADMIASRELMDVIRLNGNVLPAKGDTAIGGWQPGYCLAD